LGLIFDTNDLSAGHGPAVLVAQAARGFERIAR